MQDLKQHSLFSRVTRINGRWSVLALSVILAACQAPQAESAATTELAAANAPAAAADAPAPAPASEPAAAAADQQAAPATTVADADDDAPILDEDGNPIRPDDSYNRANLRPEYKKCVAASDAVTPALQACMEEEFLWQQKRMRAVFGSIANGPDGEFKDKVADEQDAYMRDTNRYCRFDPATQGQGQMLDAQSCRINRYANRADALEALVSK